MRVLGISCHYHDAAAALLVDGHLAAAAEEERFSRIKHDARFPRRAIEFCLRRAGIAPADVDYAVFYEKPLLKLERILLTALHTYPRSWRGFGEFALSWLEEKLWIRASIQEALGIPADRILFVEHHLSHAASAFLCSPFERAAILTVDGVGERTTTALGTGTADWTGGGRTEIRLEKETRFPHSLGLLYSAFTAFLGFEVNEGEYKVMGMAAYGEPRHEDRVRKVVRVEEDGSVALDLRYFAFHHSADRTFSRRFEALFGPPRSPGAPFFTTRTHPGRAADRAAAERNQHYADVAASIQRVTEDALLKAARHLHSSTGLDRLCMAGGVALNAVANGRILRETPFREVYVQPAAGDAGGAVGAALYAWHVVLSNPRRYVMEHAYLGDEHSEAQAVDAFRADGGVSVEVLEDDDAVADRVAGELADGKVVGWAQGRFEWGPRALGNRSILADPRTAAMKDVVNERIKFREPFRPFAPAVPAERAGEMFEIPDPGCWPARFMLAVLPWKPGAAALAPATDHGGTARLQTVSADTNPRFRALLDRFGQATGVPVLMNTSFNLRGEPMVASPVDALSTFRRSGLDLLAFGNVLVRKRG
jgi:carbamoyltransferase